MRSGLFPTPCLPQEPALSLLRGLLFLFAFSAPAQTLVVGIAGGWEPADAPWTIARRIASHLEVQRFPDTTFETFANHHLHEAKERITKHLDTNRDGTLDPQERQPHHSALRG